MEIIYSYTRKQALEDGVLIDATTMAKEAGIKFTVAVTSTLWEEYIRPSEKDRKKYFQSEEGRLWDVLWMFRTMAKSTSGDTMFFSLYFAMDGKKKIVQLKAVIGPGYDGSPVITIMLPHED